MAATPPGIAPIYKKWEEINTSRTIPEAYFETLGERLAIAFIPTERKQRRSSRGQKRDYKSSHQRRRARKIYLQVFETDLNIFIPFVLAISPRACESFSFSKFLQHHEKKTIISFSDNALLLLWRAARDYGCDKTSHFKSLVQLHNQTSLPVTGAEGKECEHWSLQLSSFAAIRSVFGDFIFDAVRHSPKEVEMGVGRRFTEITTNVWTRVPRQQPQDAVISLHVQRADEFANILFPNGSQKIISALSTYSPIMPLTNSLQAVLASEDANSESSEIGKKDKINIYTFTMVNSKQTDYAYFTLRGAFVSAFPSIFSTEICRGIDDSQLRTWERENLLVDTTDCVTMQVWRGRPQRGIIRLRIGYYAALHLANVLYKETP